MACGPRKRANRRSIFPYGEPTGFIPRNAAYFPFTAVERSERTAVIGLFTAPSKLVHLGGYGVGELLGFVALEAVIDAKAFDFPLMADTRRAATCLKPMKAGPAKWRDPKIPNGYSIGTDPTETCHSLPTNFRVG